MRAAGVPLKTVALPTEHGGWGFTLEPLLLGLLLSPGPHTLGLFLLGLFGFLARHPLKLAYQDLRKRRRYPRTGLALKVGGGYAALASLGLLLTALTAQGPFLLPLLLALPLGAYMLWADAANRSRDLFPEIAAALTMASLAPAGVLAGGLGAEIAWGSFLALALRDIAALYYARTQVLRARGGHPKAYPAHLALWTATLLALLLQGQGLLPAPTTLALLLLALYGSLALLRPPVEARVIGWTQMGFGLLVVLATALGYTLQGLPTALLGVPALHRFLGWALVGLAFVAGLYLFLRKEVTRPIRLLLGLYDLNALLGLLHLVFVWQPLPHPLLALIGVVLLHLLLRRPHPWPAAGFFLLGLLLLWH
ncbi:HAMP domain-containing protein [Thermus amyloliquefaciens]|uniref:HAMP domain-containing protein n=1 Tax=Thermus amyloliquefaciens TaxID=1449080 RepID=UPI0005717306|nr:YwiC-like family protein [Thermus amyloliquefaciens]